MKPKLKLGSEHWGRCCCGSEEGYCVVRNKRYDQQDRARCQSLTSEQRMNESYESQEDVKFYREFESHGYDHKWFEYYRNMHSNKKECPEGKRNQHEKDKRIIGYLSAQQLRNGFDKLEILCVGHYPKQFDSIGNSPVLKKINLNDLDVGEYQHNRWAEARAFVARDLFRGDAEWVGYVGASWNDKFDGPKIEEFTGWSYSRHLVNSEDLVFCACVNCVCCWKTIIERIIEEHDDIFEKIQKEFDLELKHVIVPYCNHFIAHRKIVEEYLNYLDTEEIMPRISRFVKREVEPDFVGEFYKHRVEAYLMEMINCFWWAKKDYMYVPNVTRKPMWYSNENNAARLAAYEKSLLDKNS